MQSDATTFSQQIASASDRSLLAMLGLALRTAAAPVAAMLKGSVDKSGSMPKVGKQRGRVTLVGAGPGDPDLLTIKALRAIETADVILFDALVSDVILGLARRRAKLICVGKRGGRPSCRQDNINRLMVEYANAGMNIVRLKAGDPAIFGRTGEEMSYLEAEGLKAKIVPGITAASAMAAEFGISLTHRNHAKSVRFATGHSKNGGLPEDLNWQAIADPSATTVFYMGAPFAAEISKRLVALGMPKDTPVGVASSLSRSNQRIARSTLSELAGTVAAFDRTEPLIVGIGAVYADDSLSSSEQIHEPISHGDQP
ncbi:MAG: uroporphyrinogen-III C-methyltransferase [Proteobacteria bacterium]|nr:uroporphyrinogen-III C-methyltransferase [Pseudomonadota bacterium]